MTKTKHRNKEAVVECPVDECGHEGLARGMHLHVRQSSGGGHGPNGEVPDNINFSELEKVGEKNVDMDYPDTRDPAEEVARLCPFCGRAFNGYRGVKIHVGQKKGQGVHPNDAAEITKDDCPIAHVDDDMNVIELVEERAIMPSTKRRIEKEGETVDKSEVIQLIEGLEAEGDSETADRIREALL